MIAGRASAALKRICRPELYRALETEPDDARFVEIWFSPETRKRIDAVVAGLKKS